MDFLGGAEWLKAETPKHLKVLVTGGAGFIGSAVVRFLLQQPLVSVVNVDKLTYAGNLDSLASVAASPRYSFVQVDICDRPRSNGCLHSTVPTP